MLGLSLSLAQAGQRGLPALLPLIGRGFIAPPATFSRAQPNNARSTAIGADDATWGEFAADVPRFSGSARRLLGEGQTTNGGPNPRAEGATLGVIGSGGVLPPGWTMGAGGSTTLREVVGVGVEFNLPYIDLRQAGSGAGAFEWRAAAPDPAAATGQTWAGQWFVRRVGGSMVGITQLNVIYEFSPGPTSSSAGFAASDVIVRTAVQRLMSQPGTVSASSRLNFAPPAGPWDFTLRVYAPHFEISQVPTTPVFPAVGAPAASTRGADIISAPHSALFPNGVGTLVVEGVLPFAGLAGGAQRFLLEGSDGTANNRLTLRSNAQATSLTAGRVIGGAAVDAPGLGAIAPGGVFRSGITFDGSQMRAALLGQPEQIVAGLPGGINLWRFANTNTNGSPLNGELLVSYSPIIAPPGALNAVISSL